MLHILELIYSIIGFIQSIRILVASIFVGLVQWLNYFFNGDSLWDIHIPDFLEGIADESQCFVFTIMWGFVFGVPGIIVWIVRKIRGIKRQV